MKFRAILAIALAACVLLGWWMFSNSAERQIRKLFDQVSQEMEKTGPEHPFQELSKAKALARHVGARLSIDGLGGRRDLVLNHETLPHRDSLTVIQKWHAAGKIKQSGYQTIGKPYGRGTKVAGALDMHRGYDVIIAGGKKLNPFYCASFNVTEDKLFNVGLPRQDWLLRHREGGRQQFLRQFPQYAGKKIVLYAPTFRVNDRLDCSRLVAAFDREDFALIVRPHQRHLLAEGLELDTCPGVTTVEILCACD